MKQEPHRMYTIFRNMTFAVTLLVIFGEFKLMALSAGLADGSERPVGGRSRHLDFVFAFHRLTPFSVAVGGRVPALRRRGCYFVIFVTRTNLPSVRIGTRDLRLVDGLRSSQVRYQYS